MQDLEQNFIDKIQNFTILPRRFNLKSNKIHLFGPPKSGKTSLALDFAKRFKKPAYIDCNDPRTDIESIKPLLLKLYLEKKIDILIVDNFHDSFSLPNLENVILITSSQNINVSKNFLSKAIEPLSFEEYISFDKKNLSINALFNHFLKDGNLPEIQYLNEYQKIPRKQEIIFLALNSNARLFQNIIPYQAHKITINQIYTQIKKQNKISKDKIYECINEFQATKTIYFLPHKEDKSKSKKLYFYDFSLPYAFMSIKSFHAIFENMIFLELLGKNQTLFYDEGCDFLTQDSCAYIALAFPTQEMIEEKIAKIQKKFSLITIITINYEYERKTPYGKWKAVSFINFALGES
ncbi:hypothetical protein BKH41_06180 [Helicobacter sp. 12S02232-10]|uniref:ATP-binding protein n=1 Tax=Helicobacter sp. 12S02232-10 TaxID=1476197 RepID=UPI000BA4F495|nr:ATP-binding protein [Helicobacter sp. 12S02232-10]PAF48299.1 hypothetical protein BKH41_06180 [Helicobacter sp. 12S02232-10]